VTAAVPAEQTVRALWNAPDALMPSPFDAASYEPALRLVAGNLQAEGRYEPVRATDAPVPQPSAHLVVTDDWVLIARPRRANYLQDDI
jgi:hypothetical protein